ncbi:MAG: hypothetical protein IPH44_35850 [Myxococcales bacterium]|nr:hypothetical protein [Myxococcales bacterium]MBK7191164.1 hypothetical protein [Myxococcales bacterium]MBP6844374.1 hypothetical protein [Kofleriaceae bacterium]
MTKVVYWRRDLPPLSEQIEGEHELIATSEHAHVSWAERDALWGRCYRSLTERAEARLAQEVARLGGSCAHVVDEQVASKVDDATGAMWLVGTYRYVLYRHPPGP